MSNPSKKTDAVDARKEQKPAVSVPFDLLLTQDKLFAHNNLDSMNRFSAGVAHEINNPVNFVMVGTQNASAALSRLRDFVGDLLESDADPEIVSMFEKHFDDIESGHRTVLEGGDRIRHVVVALRAACIDSDVDIEIIDLARLLQDAAAQAREGSQATITWNWDFEDRLMQTEAVLFEVDKALVAIYQNAVHAIEDTQRPGTITTRMDRIGGRLRIRISDTGPGIPPVILDNVFDPFFTTKVVGRGSGLGLTMAREIIRKYGGRLTLDNIGNQGEAGHGIMATVTLEGLLSEMLPDNS